MADWDPFADPADSPAALEATPDAWLPGCGTSQAPPDPWDDGVYVGLAQEAARLAAEERRLRKEEEEAARKAAAALDLEEAEAGKAPSEQGPSTSTSAPPAADNDDDWVEDDAEREQLLAARRARIEGLVFKVAMEAARAAPSKVASSREAAIRDYYEEEAAGGEPKAPPISDGGEDGFREAAAKMMAESMGIKIKFKTPTNEPPPPVGLLFPDQGSRSLRLLSGSRGNPAVAAMLQTAQQILGFDPLAEQVPTSIHELFRGPEAIPTWLEETRLCQPAMYISGLAAVEKLRARHRGCLERCKAVAGVSLGEYAALTFAGVFDFETCLELVMLRGEAMQEAAEASPQRMLSVAGLDRATLDDLCKASRLEGEVCQVAHCLFPDGFTCAGHAAAVERLLERVRATKGCKQAQLLKVAGSGGFHTPLMEPARQRLCEALRRVEARMQPPRMDVYLCAGAQKVGPKTRPSLIIDLLCEQLVEPVLWEESVRAMLADGIGQFYECGPMQQLKGAMKRIDSKAHGSMISLDHVQLNVRERAGPRMAEPQDVTEGPLLPGGRNRVRLVW